jgi:CRP/FNR family transcriptional regulator
MYAQAVTNPTANIDFGALAVCRGLGRQATSHVAAISTLQKLAPRKAVFCEGDTAGQVYEVVRGMVRLYKLLPDGRRQITGFLSAGHLLGLSHQDCYLYGAEAITEVTLCRYPRAQFERLVDEVPGFARRILSVTSDELRAAQDQMLLLGRKTAVEKIASFLLTMADRQAAAEEVDSVHVPMGRSDIADYLGLTMETVSRTLTKLKAQGVIALPSYAQIEMTDRDRLEEMAAGESDGEI